MTQTQRDEFMAKAKPLIEWMNNNCHPHMTIIVTHTHAELLEGAISFHTKEFLVD